MVYISEILQLISGFLSYVKPTRNGGFTVQKPRVSSVTKGKPLRQTRCGLKATILFSY